MTDKTLVERLRMTGKRISVPCPDGIDGCLVHHFRIETDPLCDEAATRIEALEAALREIVKDEGGWVLNYASDTERWYSKFVLGPMGKIAKQALESQP